MMRFKINKKFLFSIKLIVSIGLITYLIFLVDWSRAFKILKGAQIVYLVIGFLLWIFGIFFASLRWHIILKDNNVEFPIFKSYKAYLRGMFYNIFLPGVVGGDVVRVGICTFQTECKLATATSSVLIERIFGILSLFIFLLVVYTIFFDKVLAGIGVRPVRYLMLIGLFFLVIIIFSVLLRHKLMKWLSGRDLNKLLSFFYVSIEAFCSVRLRTLLIVLLLSSVFQSFDIFSCFIFGKALGIELPLPVFFGVVPLVYFATVMPISLGGLGVREGTFVFLLSKFGVGTTEVITLSFLAYFNRVIYGIIGGIVEFMESLKFKKKAKHQTLTVKGVKLNGRL